jgi:DNA-binding PadR family transcriptional regulator
VLKPLSLLDYALLGLAASGDCSGYDLRRLMHGTPMASFSDSPGSVYPALQRLERYRLLRAGAEEGGRKRRVLRVTARGRQRLVAWLDAPVTVADARRSDGSLELKLSFLDSVHPRRLNGFLREWADASAVFAAEIAVAERALGANLGKSARLAVGLGLQLARARTRYLKSAMRQAPR